MVIKKRGRKGGREGGRERGGRKRSSFLTASKLLLLLSLSIHVQYRCACLDGGLGARYVKAWLQRNEGDAREKKHRGKEGGRGRDVRSYTQRGIFLTSSVSLLSSYSMSSIYIGDHVLYLPLRRGDVTVHDERIVHGSGKSDTKLGGNHGQGEACTEYGQKGRNQCVTTEAAFFMLHGHTHSPLFTDGNTSTVNPRKTYVIAFRSKVRTDIPCPPSLPCCPPF